LHRRPLRLQPREDSMDGARPSPDGAAVSTLAACAGEIQRSLLPTAVAATLIARASVSLDTGWPALSRARAVLSARAVRASQAPRWGRDRCSSGSLRFTCDGFEHEWEQGQIEEEKNVPELRWREESHLGS
ncbi:hypothetical protein P7K49_027898, partial [Saguinus oedipus]